MAAKFWGDYDTLLCDLDGVVYEGPRAITSAPETINTLVGLGVPVGYVTNNSSRKPETIAKQLLGFGIVPRRLKQLLPVRPAQLLALLVLVPINNPNQ